MLDCEEPRLTKTTPWSAYPSGKLYISLHDGDAFGVYSTQVSMGEASQERRERESLESHARVLEEMDEKSLRRLLQGPYGRALPAQAGLTHLIVGVGHHVQGNLANLYI